MSGWRWGERSPANAAAAQIKGAELDGIGVLNDFIDLSLGLELARQQHQEFSGCHLLRPGPGGVGSIQRVCDASGNDLPNTPKLTASVAPTLTVPMATARVRVALSWHYNDGFFWDCNNARREDAYDILNASIGWSSADERLGVRLFGSNLTHSKYSIYTVSQVPGDDFAAASPRTYGVEFSFSINPR